MQALIEYWSERPRRAVALAQDAHRYAPSATARVRLFNIEARIWARIGNAEQAARCINAADDARDSAGVDLIHDEVGGVFGFPDAKSHYYAGATYIHLGDAQPALESTRHAIELYASGPAVERSYGAESLARVDEAAAHLINASLDGAAEALDPVLELPVGKRIAQLDERLTDLRRRIATPTFRDSPEATELDGRIEEFCSLTAVKELPPARDA